MTTKKILFYCLILLPLVLISQNAIDQSYSMHSFRLGEKIPPQLFPLDDSNLFCSHMENNLDQVQHSHDSTNISDRFVCSNTFQLWSNFDGLELIEELKLYNDYECFRPLFSFEEGTGVKLFSTQNFILACNELTSMSKNYNGEDEGKMYGLLIYLHSFLYHDFNQTTLNLGEVEMSVLKATVQEYLKNQFIYKETLGAFKNLAEFYILCDNDGIRNLPEVVMSFKKTLTSLTVDDTWMGFINNSSMLYYNYLKIYSVNYAVFRGVANGDQSFIDLLDSDQDFIALLASSVNENDLDGLQYLVECPRLIIVELLRMCNVPSLVDNVEPHIASIAKSRPRYGSFWYRCIVAINMKGNCELYDLCENIEEVKSKVTGNLFPNKWIFEDGKISISTPLDFETAQKVYYASKEVEAQFYRLNLSDMPLADDNSDSLKIIVYGSRTAYEEWQYVLNGLNTNNGGIYIERTATFYTYERTPQESIYSLEELFRHEYVHYLVGRYIDPNYWGETNFYTNEQLTWFNEGMGEHMSGSTARDGIKLRKSIGEELKKDTSRMNIFSIVNAKYSSGFTFYRYANVLIRFLVEKEPELFKNMMNTIKNLDLEGYNTIITNLYTDPIYESNFQNYLQKTISNPDEWRNPQTEVADIESLELKNLNDVKQYFLTLDKWKKSDISQSATLSLGRFKILFSKDEAGCEIDDCLTMLKKGKNNLEFAVGYAVIENSKEDYIITGPLGNPFVGTKDLKNVDIKVFPNPSQQTIAIEWHDRFEKLEVITPFNQIVSQHQVQYDKKINLDISALPAAMYLLKFIDDKQIKIAKFIKI